MPEEINRLVADRLSGLLLCSTQTAVDNLAAEGQGESARLVGDVMADVALAFGPIADRRSTILDRVEVEDGTFLLATAHRAENVDRPERLERLVEILVAAREMAPVVFPVHPRTRARLDAAGLADRLQAAAVETIDPVGYLDLTRLLHGSRAVLTDSGGLQKEAYLAGVPCVTMRPVTEWVETVESGWNRLVDLDLAVALDALRELGPLRDGPPPDPSVYGGGSAGVRVVDELGHWLA